MPIKFTTSDDEARISGVKMLVYAPAGMGKTVLTATLPSPLLISTEKGLLSLNARNQQKIFGTAKNVPIIEVNCLGDLDDALRFVATSNEAKQFESISMDSISDMAECVLSELKAKYKDPRQAYGDLFDKLCVIVRGFRDLPGKHVYLTAKQERIQDSSGLLMNGPSMPGKQLTGQLPHFFDEVFALDVSPKQADGSTYRFLRTQNTPQWLAKDRSGALDEFEQPNLANIIAKIQSTTG